MYIDKYINGFENGWFSTKHTSKDGGSFSNCSSNNEDLNEMSLDTVRHLTQCMPFTLYCNPIQPLINRMVLYEVETITTKDEVRKIESLKKYSYILKKEFGVTVVTDRNIPNTMWFAVWGEGKKGCYGSKGDYSLDERLIKSNNT